MSTHLSITVDLSAIAGNWRRLQSRLGASDCGAVVKANAYGLGMKEVSSALYQAGCQSFFVTNHEEAIELRECLGEVPTIYVLQGVEKGVERLFVQHALTPVLISLPMAMRWQAFTEKYLVGKRFIEQNFPERDLPERDFPKRHAAEKAHAARKAKNTDLLCALKVNTGMNRLGVDMSELDSIIAHCPSVFSGNAPVLMSHLACADEPEHELNAVQLNNFNQVLKSVREYYPSVRASLANSSGIFLGQDFHFDLARPGAALYGLNPTPAQSNPMQSVVSLKLPILQLRQANQGAVAGYGAEKQLDRPSLLATVGGGYADGIARRAFDGLRGWVNGCKVSLAGRVSMDTLIFDVTDVANIESATAIEILGKHINADEQGLAAGTIGYEVLTRIGDRVTRQYVSSN